VTISAAYGAGGSVVAARVAEALGVRLLDRAISSTVAAQLRVTVQEAEGAEISRSRSQRLLSFLSPLAGGVLGAGTDAAPPGVNPFPGDAEDFREQVEAVIREALPHGMVVLGRAGSAALRQERGVLHVRLFGPEAARAKQAARVEQIDERAARERLPHVDNARRSYVRRLYRVDVDDPALYHVQLDSTALSLEACTDIIVRAYRDLTGTA
jgi:cytidylate kinase